MNTNGRAMHNAPAPDRSVRNKRRRSRQCRGRRARNYVRTLARIDARYREEHDQLGQLVGDALATGAMDSFSRLRQQLEETA